MTQRFMNLVSHCLAIAISILLLFGCGDGGLIGDDGDTDSLTPDPVESEDDSAKPRPSENAPVITTTDNGILDIAGLPILLRGVNLQFGDNPNVRIAGIEPIAQLGANVVRLQLRESTTAGELEAALNKIVENDMIALVMLWEEEGKITCTEDDTFLFQAVDDLWLGEWLPVLAQDRYQPHLMINIANEWGPMNILNANSVGYSDFIANYKILIRQFRNAGFKVPLVIDAPHCGQDYNAFLGGRGRELRAADAESNLVLSVHAYHNLWNTSDKIIAATDQLAGEGVPFIVGEFGGSGVNGDSGIDHLDLMAKGLGDKSLIFRLPWEAGDDSAAFVYTLQETLNVTGAVFAYDVYLPDIYVEDGNLGLRLYMRDLGGRSAGFGVKTVRDLRGNAWNRIEYSVDTELDSGGVEDGFDFSRIAQIGLEVLANGKAPSIQHDLKIDNLTVAIPDQPGMSLFQAGFDTDTESWSRAWGAQGATPVTQADGALLVMPDWSTGSSIAVERANIVQLDPALDLSSPITVSASVYLPPEYASEPAFYFKFFFQDGDDWTWYDTGGTPLDQFTPGGWTTVSIDIPEFPDQPESFNTTLPPNRFGFEIGGISAGQMLGVMVDDIQITGSASIPAETVLALQFDAESEVTAFDFDFAGGSFDEYRLEASRIHGFGIQPFGWLAWSWKGNGPETQVLDMSTSEDSVVLTARGEDIANSDVGIAATAQPVNFQ